MAFFIKTGYWEKLAKASKGWLNLDTVISDVVADIPNKVLSQITTSSIVPSKEYEYYDISALSSSLNIANPTVQFSDFDAFIIRVTDNGTSRALTYGDMYVALDTALPSATTIGKTLIYGCIYDTASNKINIKATEEV